MVNKGKEVMKMKVVKKFFIIAATLVCLLLCSCFIMGCGNETNDLQYTLSGDGYVVSGIGTCTDSDLVIPSVYNGKPVIGIANSAFRGCRDLTSVTIPEGITKINNSAFYGCSGLSRVTLPDSVTVIDKSAFTGCGNLTELKLPSGITEIGDQAFYGCEGIMSITVPSSVTKIGNNAFSCARLVEVYNLSQLKITEGSNYNGAIAENAFKVHTDANAKSGITVADNGCVFYEDEGVSYVINYIGESESLIIPDTFNGKKCEINGGAFLHCEQLKSVTLPQGITSIPSHAFYGSGLTSVTLPDGVTAINTGAFGNCGMLTNITIPESVTEIGYQAFTGCENLKSITIPDSVTKIDVRVFTDCFALTSINYNGTMEQWEDAASSGFAEGLSNYKVYCTDGEIIPNAE